MNSALDGTPIVFKFRRTGRAYYEQLLVVPSGPLDAPAVGWRNAFSWCGLIGIAYALPLYLCLRERTASAM